MRMSFQRDSMQLEACLCAYTPNLKKYAQLLDAVDEHGEARRADVVDDVEPEPPVVDAVLHHLLVVVMQRAVVQDVQHQRGGRLAAAEHLHDRHPRRPQCCLYPQNTVCSTLAAVLLTPLLTKVLAGAYIPVDAVKLSLSTLQVVVAPILLGSSTQSAFPSVTPFAPLLAVLASSLLACSVFSENFVRLRSTIASNGNGNIFSGDIGVVMLSVCLLHFAGFFVGVGMQNSSLGVVLATAHFSSPLVALPPALSAVIMNIMGSTLGLVWQNITPSVLEDETSDKPNA
ncbi:hypothetical protein ACP70R_006907 [Stipagrostis hirtigluma subsp. patula]